MIKFCSLFSGSSGNSIFVGTEDTKILIDAGLSGKKVAEALESIGEDPTGLSAIFITHEHADHIAGAGILSRRYNVPIYANAKTWNAIGKSMGKLSEENKKTIDGDIVFSDIRVHGFSTSHDAAEPMGYSFYHDGKKVTVATDTGIITDSVRQNVLESDVVLLESNHDTEMLKNGRYPYYLKKRILGDHGHLSNDTAAEFLVELVERGTERIFLGHLSEENNTPEVAYGTACDKLRENGINPKSDVNLKVASRYYVSEAVTLK